MKVMMRAFAAATLLLAGTGCTESKPLLDEFSWELVQNQADVTEGLSIAGFFGDINFLAAVKTPNLCYAVASSLDSDGTALTIHVNMTPSGSGTCAQQAGGVRYSGVIRNLSSGTYTVHIIQNVSGVGITEYNETVKL